MLPNNWSKTESLHYLIGYTRSWRLVIQKVFNKLNILDIIELDSNKLNKLEILY